MNDLALLLFAEEHADEINKNIFKEIFSKVHNLFKKKEIELEFEIASMYNGSNVYFIKLPYSKDNMENMEYKKLSKIAEGLETFLNKKNVMYGIYPSGLQIALSNRFIESRFSGRHLYKGLFRRILRYIYDESNISLADFDIAVISGEDREETKAVIDVLSPSIKYLTVMDTQQDAYTNLIDKVYEETGLSVALTGDLRTALKSADILINLSSSIKPAGRIRMKSGALLINYGRTEGLVLSEDNVVINGVELDYKEVIPENIKKEFYRYYKKTEFLEMLISSYIKEGDLKSTFFNNSIISLVEEEFDKSGGYIMGFRGMHSTIKKKDILEIINKR